MIEIIKDMVWDRKFAKYDLSFLEDPCYGKWRIEKDLCQFIGSICEELKPERVLEFGTGLSTHILANEACKGNIKELWSIDHLSDFPGHPKHVLKKEKFANFCYFPLKLKYIAGKIFYFYSIPKDFFEKIGPIDLVIIDGPPYYYNSREAAMYIVYPYLNNNALILLDDAGRKNKEGLYIENWKSYFGANIEEALFLNEFKKGLACLCHTGRGDKCFKFNIKDRMRDSLIGLRSIGKSILRGEKCLL